MHLIKISSYNPIKTLQLKACVPLLIPVFFSLFACKKFVEIPPPENSITADFVFATNASAISVLTDIYSSMNKEPIQAGSGGNIGLFAGLAADEYKLNDGLNNTSFSGYYTNTLNAEPGTASGSEHWAPLYNFVFRCNAAIEGLNASNTLLPIIKEQLLGEAKFMRAFFYFYLVNMFGDVPIALTTDPEVNNLLPRASSEQVYDQIKLDLTEAYKLLNDNFLDITLLNNSTERVRPTKSSAAALLSRVYLFTDDWINAEIQSSLLINNTQLFTLPDSLNEVFLKNSKEAIWQIQPVESGFNTLEARALIIPETGPIPGTTQNPVQMSSHLFASFEDGDKRALDGKWIKSITVENYTYKFPFKYKMYLPNADINTGTQKDNMTEYFMVLRLSEQYLIRAEARARLNNISGARNDINAIRYRAGLPNTTAEDTPSLLDAILHERQVELFSEWGHRWFDLKRTGKIDEVMALVTPLKSDGTSQWNSYQQLYPISLTELQRAPNLTQTAGY